METVPISDLSHPRPGFPDVRCGTNTQTEYTVPAVWSIAYDTNTQTEYTVPVVWSSAYTFNIL